MGRKFVGYVQYSWDDFSIFGSDAEKSTVDVVKKTLSLARKYDSLVYKIIKDSPFEAVVFATEDFTEEEGEQWFELYANEEEQYVYEQLCTLFKKDMLQVHQHNIQDVLNGEIDEYLVESDETSFIFRYDRILVVSKQDAFVHFSVRTDKLYRWFYNE